MACRKPKVYEQGSTQKFEPEVRSMYKQIKNKKWDCPDFQNFSFGLSLLPCPGDEIAVEWENAYKPLVCGMPQM